MLHLTQRQDRRAMGSCSIQANHGLDIGSAT